MKNVTIYDTRTAQLDTEQEPALLRWDWEGNAGEVRVEVDGDALYPVTHKRWGWQRNGTVIPFTYA